MLIEMLFCINLFSFFAILSKNLCQKYGILRGGLKKILTAIKLQGFLYFYVSNLVFSKNTERISLLTQQDQKSKVLIL